jgi:hypothetical protein
MRFKLRLEICTKQRQPTTIFFDGFSILASFESPLNSNTHSLEPEHKPSCATQSGIAWKPAHRGGMSSKVSSRDVTPKVNSEAELDFSKQSLDIVQRVLGHRPESAGAVDKRAVPMTEAACVVIHGFDTARGLH